MYSIICETVCVDMIFALAKAYLLTYKLHVPDLTFQCKDWRNLKTIVYTCIYRVEEMHQKLVVPCASYSK